MKLFKISLLTLGLTFSLNSFSQESIKISSEAEAKDLANKMKYELNLDEDQFKKVETLYISYYIKSNDIKNKANTNPENKNEELKNLDKTRINKLKSFLSEEQFKKQITIESSNKKESSK